VGHRRALFAIKQSRCAAYSVGNGAACRSRTDDLQVTNLYDGLWGRVNPFYKQVSRVLAGNEDALLDDLRVNLEISCRYMSCKFFMQENADTYS
jgi:hypothetical protein